MDNKSTVHICFGSYLEAIRRGTANMAKTFAERIGKSSSHMDSPSPDSFWKSPTCHMAQDSRWVLLFFYSWSVFQATPAWLILHIVVLNTVWKRRTIRVGGGHDDKDDNGWLALGCGTSWHGDDNSVNISQIVDWFEVFCAKMIDDVIDTNILTHQHENQTMTTLQTDLRGGSVHLEVYVLTVKHLAEICHNTHSHFWTSKKKKSSFFLKLLWVSAVKVVSAANYDIQLSDKFRGSWSANYRLVAAFHF